MMKEKTLSLFLNGYQVALTALLLILITISIAAHLISGHFGFIGFIVAAALWYLVYGMFKMAIREYKAEKNSKSSNE